jgi:hypothetical protein
MARASVLDSRWPAAWVVFRGSPTSQRFSMDGLSHKIHGPRLGEEGLHPWVEWLNQNGRLNPHHTGDVRHHLRMDRDTVMMQWGHDHMGSKNKYTPAESSP